MRDAAFGFAKVLLMHGRLVRTGTTSDGPAVLASLTAVASVASSGPVVSTTTGSAVQVPLGSEGTGSIAPTSATACSSYHPSSSSVTGIDAGRLGRVAEGATSTVPVPRAVARVSRVLPITATSVGLVTASRSIVRLATGSGSASGAA